MGLREALWIFARPPGRLAAMVALLQLASPSCESRRSSAHQPRAGRGQPRETSQLGRHDRALTSSLAPPGGSTEATKERLICSPIELASDGAILLRQDGRASWASFHGKSDGRRVFTVEFKRGELERLLGQEADGDR